jgi:hypothetical protein
MQKPADILEKELDDFLEMVKRQLKNYTMMLVKEQYHNLYQEYQQLLVKNEQLKVKLKENNIVWEK